MAIENINDISVNGDNNIVVQGTNNSTITINTQNSAEIKAFCEEHKAQMNIILELLKGRQEPILKQFGEQIYNIHTIGTANFNQAVLRGCTIQAGKANFYVDNEALVQAFFQASNEPLRILVITETAGAMQKILPTHFEEIERHYSFALEYWRPFAGEKDITDLLKEFQEKTGYQLEVGFAGVHTWQNYLVEKHTKTLKIRCKNTILVADSFALDHTRNATLAKVFDDFNVGGCILPLQQNLSDDAVAYAKKLQADIFPTLSESMGEFHENLKDFVSNHYHGLVQVELEVHSKADFFRRLANIAHYHLGVGRMMPITNKLKKLDSGNSQDF
ncbi:MAG: hypothetical protein EAZ95_10320 [Bacteroidetes bacterium]|nr:MAG: hypothetical protein EAZ95_10320 [Bacteroidota bacterium]